MKVKKSQLALLDPLARDAMEHWKEFRPTMYRKLKEKKRLELQALKAADQTRKEMQSMMQNGATWPEAWEAVRERYIYLPEEEGLQHPGEDEELPVAGTHNLLVEAMRLMNRVAEEYPETRKCLKPIL